MKPSSLMLIIFSLSALQPTEGLAQAYPDRAVRVMVPFPPGGSLDIAARIVFQKMTATTGQPFVVDNRGGAAGTVGALTVAKSAPNGYTILVHSPAHLINAHINKDLPYDALNDFVAVAPLVRQLFVLVVHPSMPTRSVGELVALAKKRPGQIRYASGGNASTLHLAMALFNSMTETDMIHVPYKGGAPAALSNVMGETQASISVIASVISNIKAKQLRLLGVGSAQRATQFPDVPTIAETVPGYEFIGWIGCFVPAMTPMEIVGKLNAELGKVLENPEVARRLEDQTLDPIRMTPQAFAKFLKADYEKYGKLIKKTSATNE